MSLSWGTKEKKKRTGWNLKIPMAISLIILLWIGVFPCSVFAISASDIDYEHSEDTVNSVGTVSVGKKDEIVTFICKIKNTSTSESTTNLFRYTEGESVFQDIEYIPGSASVNGQPFNAVYSQNPPSDQHHPNEYKLSFAIGVMAPGEEKTIAFQGKCLADGAFGRSGSYGQVSNNHIWGSTLIGFVATYKVTYHANNNTSTSYPLSNRLRVGRTHTVLKNNDSNLNFTYAGQSFLGWSTSPNATTADYTGDELVGDTTELNDTLNLYAVWGVGGGPGVSTYTVTYDANTGTGTAPSDSTSYSSGATVTVLGGSQLSKSGYSFNGWNTAANGSGTSYSTGSTFNISANTTLYAQWTANSSGGGGGTTPTTEAPPTTSTSTEGLPATTEDLSATTEVDIPDFDDPTEESDGSTSDQIAKPTKNSKPPKATTPPRFNGNSRTPATGDASNYMLHITALLASVITLIVAYERKKKI